MVTWSGLSLIYTCTSRRQIIRNLAVWPHESHRHTPTPCVCDRIPGPTAFHGLARARTCDQYFRFIHHCAIAFFRRGLLTDFIVRNFGGHRWQVGWMPDDAEPDFSAQQCGLQIRADRSTVMRHVETGSAQAQELSLEHGMLFCGKTAACSGKCEGFHVPPTM
jgi:hypothetical protein